MDKSGNKLSVNRSKQTENKTKIDGEPNPTQREQNKVRMKSIENHPVTLCMPPLLGGELKATK